jgi:trypsin-like peptidase
MPKVCGFLVTLMFVGAQAAALEPHEIVERVAPSVWVVRAGGTALGSAVVVAPGRLITNCHVVSRAKGVQVAKDNVSFDATVEYSDTQRDLCQLSVRNFFAPAVTLAPMQSLKLGQRVYSVASPRGQELALNEGMVSSLLTATDGTPLIQITVPVARGASGGGLFDANARLVGITSYVASEGPTMNFAQPSDWIQEVPERAKAVLATPGPGSAIPSSPYPRQLTGEELAAHFANLGRVNVMEPSALLSLTFRPGRRFTILYLTQYQPNGVRQEGSYSVSAEKNQVCLQLTMDSGSGVIGAGGAVGSEWMLDCFAISQTGEKTYSLKAVKSARSFSYALR